jgi:hypothetical protein
MFSPYSIKTPFMKTSSLHYYLPTILMQPISHMMMTPTSGPSDKLVHVTCALFLNAAEVATVKVDTSMILKIDDDIQE